jgi:hypothetical protein
MEQFMGYQINFNGAVTPELGQLLHAVQRQLNWHVIHAEGATDTASAASTVPTCDPSDKDCASTTHGGHEPSVVVVAVVALIVGIAIGYVLGKRSGSPQVNT